MPDTIALAPASTRPCTTGMQGAGRSPTVTQKTLTAVFVLALGRSSPHACVQNARIGLLYVSMCIADRQTSKTHQTARADTVAMTCSTRRVSCTQSSELRCAPPARQKPRVGAGQCNARTLFHPQLLQLHTHAVPFRQQVASRSQVGRCAGNHIHLSLPPDDQLRSSQPWNALETSSPTSHLTPFVND